MKRLLATISILSLLLPNIVFGAVAIDSPSSSASITGSSGTPWTQSFSHTATGGANSLLVCSPNNGSNPARTVTSASYNSIALTKLEGDTESGGQYRTEIWYLINPSAGANTVSFVWSGSASGNDFGSGCTSFTGVNTASPFGATTTAQSTCTSCSVDIASAIGDVVYAAIATDASAITEGVSLTKQWEAENVGADSSFGVMTVVATTTTTTMYWTQVSSGSNRAGVAIKAAATNSISHIRMILGNIRMILGKIKMILP